LSISDSGLLPRFAKLSGQCRQGQESCVLAWSSAKSLESKI
jgi:hypothetical protein